MPTIATAKPMLAQFNRLSSVMTPLFAGKKKKVSKVTLKATAYVTNNDTVKLTFEGVLLATK